MALRNTDLMIGDWVCTEHDPTPRQIDWIRTGEVGLFWNKVATPPYLVPIPLTPEILEKNGFKKCNIDTDGAIQYDFGNENLGVDIWINTKPCLLGAWRTWPGETKSYTMVEELPINYVHELQHALKLCGIEKEIIL